MPPSATGIPAARPQFAPDPPIVVGLMGGIAAGKSAVAALFATHGLQHVDADRIARTVAGQPEVLAAITRRFGPQVVVGTGQLDRARLAAVVFADPVARADLEAITHPRIRQAILAELAAARAAGRSALLDAPLLLEGGLIDLCARTVFVDTRDDVRQARARQRGWDDGELARREATQAPLALKRARATATIDNSGELADTAAQVAALLSRWSTPTPPTR